MRRILLLLTVFFFWSGAAATARASTITLDFESFADLDEVGTTIPGFTFTNAFAVKAFWTAGGSLNDDDFPPRSGDTVVTSDSMSVVFDTAMYSVGAFFTYFLDPSFQLQLQAFDAANHLVATALSAFSANGLLSGEAGSAPNEGLFVSSLLGIKSIVISGGPFVMDDLTVNTAFPGSSPVPEPGTLTLLAVGGAVSAARRRRAHRGLLLLLSDCGVSKPR